MEENQQEDLKREKFLFYIAALLTLWWIYIVGIESLNRNYGDHTVTWSMTAFWGASLATYLWKKHANRWGKISDGKIFGEYLAALVVVFVMIVSTLYMQFSWVKIPDQLFVGGEMSLTMLFGNELVKFLNFWKMNDQAKNNNGK